MRRSLFRTAFVIAAGIFIASCSETPTASKQLTPVFDLSGVPRPQVVISQIYGAGGNSGATIKNDFIELFNPGSTSVDMSGWSVQYASAGGSSWQVTPINGALAPGQYYLIQEAAGAGGTVSLSPDTTGTIPMAGAAGKVALVSSTAALSGTCPTTATIVDMNGYGTTPNCGGTTAALPSSNTYSATRKDFGCTYTGTTSLSFDIVIAQPRNRASAKHLCGPIVTVTPPSASLNVGGTQQFAAAETAADGSPVSTTFTWSSSNSGIASVSASGFVSAVSGGTATITATAADHTIGTATVTVASAPPPLPTIRFSEIHYDNSGADVDEAIEVEGPSGTDLTGWQVVLYNGGNGAPYMTNTLSGRIFDRCSGRGVAVVNYVDNSVQNGDPDGFALIDASGAVVEFLSYGGAFTATSGPALGQTSRDIGVKESGSQTGTSIKRNSTGAWSAPTSPASFGACNENDVAPAAPAGLVITELLADPSAVDDNKGEWIEIYNPTASAVDLKDWKIFSAESGVYVAHTITDNVSVPSKGFVVVGANKDAATNGGVNVAYQWSGITLSNSTATEFIAIGDPYYRLADRVNWNGYTPTAGVARAVIDPTLDNLLINGPNWEDAGAGTPGSGDFDRGPIVSLTVTASPAYVGAGGGTRQLTYSAKDAQDRTVRTVLAWTSSDASVATVDGNGLVTGVNVGDATITAQSANGVQGSAVVHVLAPGTPAYVIISMNTPQRVPVGFTKPAFFSSVRDANDAVVGGFFDLTWSTDDPSIATVDQQGYASGVSVGTTRVRATTTNGATGSVSFTVIPETAPTSAIYRNHLEFGMPADANPADDFIITRAQFVTSYSSTRGGPNWVAWDLNASQFGAAVRCDCFTTDPQAPAPAVRDADYRNGGYDRGHMVQSESRTTTDQENASTFLLSNILPQAANNNQGPWAQFENYLNDLARNNGKEIYIVAGGQFAENPGTLKDEGKVAIPDYTWKVAVVMAGAKGVGDVHWFNDLQVIAVRMPNLLTTAASIRSTPWQTFQVNVDDIEAATGYDLLSALPDYFEKIIESNDHFPTAAVTSTALSGNEGFGFTFDASPTTDSDAGDVLTYAWSFGDGSTGTGTTATHAYADNGTYNANVIVTDKFGAADTAYVTVTVANVAPVIGSVSAPADAQSVSSPVAFSMSYSDAGSADTHTAVISWGDGTSDTLQPTNGSLSTTHTYSAAGFYTIQVTLTDDDGASATASTGSNVIVYDAAAGFVTGGGWVDAGGVKTNIGMNLQYLRGEAAPHGQLELNNSTVNFHADAFEWMVLSGNAVFAKGTGRMQGSDEVLDVRVYAVDNQKDDAVRVRITRADGSVVFDNEPGAALLALPTAVLRGQVQVHN